MGLIKTAIMTGGGIYAVNKLAKAAENHHNNPQANSYPQNYQRDANYPPQGYWGPYGPQGSPQRGPTPPAGYYSDNQEQRQLASPPNSQQYDQSYAPGYSAGDYADSKYPADSSYERRDQQNNLPAYHQQPQGYLPPQNQGYDHNQNMRSSSPMAGLAGMAMEFVGSGKDRKGGKTSDRLSEFFSK
jgi:hypothetical protein